MRDTTFYDYYFKICGKSNGGDVLIHTTVTSSNLDDFYYALARAIKITRPNADIITSIEYYGKKVYTL